MPRNPNGRREGAPSDYQLKIRPIWGPGPTVRANLKFLQFDLCRISTGKERCQLVPVGNNFFVIKGPFICLYAGVCMQAIPGFGGFYHPAFAALHRTASQLISQSEAARKVPNFCAAQI